MSKSEYLTDNVWAKIEPLLPKLKSRGRPWRNNRQVLEGILWILRTGAPWKDMPERYPSPSTCWRRLRMWEEEEVWLDIWRAFLKMLNEREQIDWSECFMDGTFASAKKGASVSGKPSGARERSLWWWQTARVFLWECPFTLRPRTRSRSRAKRSQK
jgi:transposase